MHASAYLRRFSAVPNEGKVSRKQSRILVRWAVGWPTCRTKAASCLSVALIVGEVGNERTGGGN